MPEIDRGFLRKLAEWSSNGSPVSSMYLDVDGRRFPRKQDLTPRAEDLCNRLREQASGLDREGRSSVTRDAELFAAFLRGLERGRTRGVALFSSSAAGLWEEVRVPCPLPDRARVGMHPFVLPLEALVETYEDFCTCLVDREKARILVARMGEIHEEQDVLDDVPGQHDQGGWSQARYARHIDEHAAQHLKRVALRLLRVFERRGFDHLILAGPDELVPEFERGLHDYLRRRVVARVNMPMASSADQLLERSLAIEEGVALEKERRVVERLTAEAAAGRNGVIGLEAALNALNDARVDTLVVPFGLLWEGRRCTGCGRLALAGRICATCGGAMEAVPDIVEEAVAMALGQGTDVEALSLFNAGPDGGFQDVGALLRYRG